MTSNESLFAVILFCEKFDGVNPNNLQQIKDKVKCQKINKTTLKVSKNNYDSTIYKCQENCGLFWYRHSSKSIQTDRASGYNAINANSYKSFESFIKDFEINLEDIV